MSNICNLEDQKNEDDDDQEDEMEEEENDNQKDEMEEEEENDDQEDEIKEEEDDDNQVEEKDQTQTKEKESGEEEKEKPEGKSRRISFELPAGFIVLNKGTKRRTWKEYQSPDGIYISVETFCLSNLFRKEIPVSPRHQERLRE